METCQCELHRGGQYQCRKTYYLLVFGLEITNRYKCRRNLRSFGYKFVITTKAKKDAGENIEEQMIYSIDKMIMREAKMRKQSLLMAWIDYKKAYDIVPHSWIIDYLETGRNK